MNLETSLMGFRLRNPLIVGSSSLTGTLKNVITCYDEGAGALVLKSLYEEQIINDLQLSGEKDKNQLTDQAMQYVNSLSEGVEQYLELIRSCKSQIDIPVIASVNCFSMGNWVKFSKKIEEAGADALELNISMFPKDGSQTSASIEKAYCDIVREVRKAIDMPIAVKMSFYFTNIIRMAQDFVKAGASALVLFNRYYRPDINTDNLHMMARDTLSCPEEISLPLRWIGILSNKINCELVASTGVYDAPGAIKQLLVGAQAVQVCSVLYENGLSYISEMLSDLSAWMNRKGFNSISEFRGLVRNDPHNDLSWERIHFMKKSEGDIIKPISNL